MATANIQSLRNGITPVIGASRDDLVLSDVVTTTSINVGTSYAWSLAFKPEGSAAVFASTVTESAINRSPGTFDVDKDGPYLIRLAYTTPQITLNTVLAAGVTFTLNGVLLTAVGVGRTPGSNDFSVLSGTIAGITADMVAAINDVANSFAAANLAVTDASPTVIVNPISETVPSGETITGTYSGTASDVTFGEDTTEQYVRLRALTSFASLKLVAAGERYDTLRVPVDATASGWADEQNFNLLALLGVASVTVASTRVLYVDAVNGDYQTIQAAMDDAQSQVPTNTEQWIVLVRPGIYVEALTFYPWVNLFGWPGGEGTPLVCVRNSTGVSQNISLANASHTLTVVNIYFQQIAASAVPTLSQSGSGKVSFLRCSLQSQGNGGEAYRGVTGVVLFVETEVLGGTVLPTDYAINLLGGSGSLTMHRCRVTGRSGLLLGDQTQAEIRDCHIQGSGDVGINTNAARLEIDYSEISNSTTSLAFNSSGAGTSGDATTTIRWSRVGNLTADGTNLGGVGRLDLGSTEHGTVIRTLGVLGVATVPSDTIFYDNSLVAHSRVVDAVELGGDLTATNVQDALDAIYSYAIIVRTLDDAYDGGVTATGVGRTIVADQGAVQVVDSVAPSDPIPPGNPSGNLEIVGAIKVGGINKPEITVDPNPFGNGPAVHLGREIWANDAPSGSTALILGNATGSPMYHNYNLRVGTQHADGGAPHGVGELFLRGGDSLAAIDAGSIYIQAGTATLAGGAGGDIYVVPGGSTLAATEGSIVLGRPSTATSATLTAGGAMGAGTATAGIVQFGTDMGSFTITLAGGELVGDVRTLFDATGLVGAAGDPIVLTTVAAGPTAEIFFLNTDVGVDASIGTFSGQVMVAGTWPETVAVGATALNEITIGEGGATGPLIYNAETGKLTVPGVIDPTGMIFSESTLAAITNNAVAGWTGVNQGGLFVSDGTGGLLDNHLYFVFADGVTTVDLSGGGGGTLQDAYNAGNTITTSGATHIDFTLSSAGGGFLVDGTVADEGFAGFGSATRLLAFTVEAQAMAFNSTQGASFIGGANTDFRMNADAAADRTLLVNASNVGAGAGDLTLDAEDQITVGGTNTLAPIIKVVGGANTEILNLSQTTGASFGLFAGTADPNGTVSAPAGSLFVRDTGAGASLHQNKSAGTGTVWEDLSGALLDRHHINMPESGGTTVDYIGWAVVPCTLTLVKVLMSTVNTIGTYTLTITNHAGTTVLNAALFDMNSLGAGAVTTLTLTAVAADLAFAVDDKWTIALTSSDAAFDGQGIYIDLTFELT